MSEYCRHASTMGREDCCWCQADDLRAALAESQERERRVAEVNGKLREALKAYRFMEQTCGGVNPHPVGTNKHRAFVLGRAALDADELVSKESFPTERERVLTERVGKLQEALVEIQRYCFERVSCSVDDVDDEGYHPDELDADCIGCRITNIARSALAADGAGDPDTATGCADDQLQHMIGIGRVPKL